MSIRQQKSKHMLKPVPAALVVTGKICRMNENQHTVSGLAYILDP